MAGVLCPYFVAHIKTDDNIIFQVGYSLNKVLFFIGSKIFYSWKEMDYYAREYPRSSIEILINIDDAFEIQFYAEEAELSWDDCYTAHRVQW